MKLVSPAPAPCLVAQLTSSIAAVEEAIRLRERLKDQVKSIKVVTIGPAKAVETLRTALAMGVDSAIHVEVPETLVPEPIGVAKTLRAIIEQEGGVDMVIMGKQAIDDDAGQTGQMLAGLLSWPQATFASKIDVQADLKSIEVTREIDGGLENLKCRLPAIITTDLRYDAQICNAVRCLIFFPRLNGLSTPFSQLRFICRYFQSLDMHHSQIL